jgi:sugar O-acyltransferase (sialic acid O-acetyltransferase NeuD family)
MKDLLLFPFGGNSREALEVIEAINRTQRTWNVLGFVDDDPAKKGQGFLGAQVLGDRKLFDRYKDAMVIAVCGTPETFRQRKEIIESLKLSPGRFANAVHPRANLSSDVSVGYNTVVLPGVYACGNVIIGNHCFIRPNTVVSHDSRIGDYCLVGSNVSISGGVTLGALCYIGSSAVFRQNISIGEATLVGMGAVVTKPVLSHSVVAGNPAKPL